MRTVTRALTSAATAALLVLAGIHIVTVWRADARVATDPAAALRLRGDHPGALLALARAQLRQGQREAAAQTARRLLAREPAAGAAFAVLAQALGDEGGSAAALERYRIAARRAPRDTAIRGWLAAHDLEAGDFDEALEHLDALLVLSTTERPALLKSIAGLAADPAFADALAARLKRQPRWRPELLRAASALDAPAAADPLFGALQRNGDLAAAERKLWLDALIGQGRWGEAFARWAGSLSAPQADLPLLYNGDFAIAPAGAGFDWRVQRTEGVVFERLSGDDGFRVTLRFLGPPVGRVGLEHPLLLAPGRHRLALHMRAADLRSDAGLEWSLVCAGSGRRLAALRMRPEPQWTRIETDFEVPAGDCDGQWLRLANPAARGVAQRVHGELELRDVAIERTAP